MSALFLGNLRPLTRVPLLLLLLRPPFRVPLAAARGRALCEAAGKGTGGEGQPPPPPPPPGPPFDLSLLEVLACPLSKKPLRYEESTNELINEELGIAYPITDGIPNMIPQAARMIGKEKQEEEPERT